MAGLQFRQSGFRCRRVGLGLCHRRGGRLGGLKIQGAVVVVFILRILVGRAGGAAPQCYTLPTFTFLLVPCLGRIFVVGGQKEGESRLQLLDAIELLLPIAKHGRGL